MKYDGSIKFDTSIDTKKFETGIAKLEKTAVKGMAGISAAVVAGIGAATKAGMDFEEAMSSVAAISMATGKDLEMLTDAAKEMGETTKYSATQAANALEYLSLAGYSAEESVRALPQVLSLAAAGGMDLAYASDLLTDSMAVMGLGIDNMQNFSDQLAMAASKSNTSVQQLGEAVLVAGGQAKLANMSVVEMNTALGILADKGIKGSEGGTALRNTLKNLYTPTSGAADMLEKLGVKTSDAQGKLLPMQDVLMKLEKALSGLSEADKIAAMSEIFDTRTIAAATALLDDCGTRWNDLEGYLSDCDGAAEQMADTMNDNLKGQLVLMASAAEGLGITVYEAIGTKLKDSVTIASGEISKLTRSLKGGELKPAIENVGKLFTSAADITIEFAGYAIPLLINSLGFVGEHLREITVAGIAFIAVYKGFTIISAVNSSLKTMTILLPTANVMMSAHSVIVGVLTGKIALASAAQAAWNAIQKASPTGLVIAGVASVVGVIASYIAKANEATEAEKAHQEAIEEDTQAIEAAAQAYSDYKKQQAETVNENISQIKNVKKLSDELFTLADENGKVADSEKSRANFILNELNKALGTEYRLTGNIIDNYSNLKNSIYEVIEAKKYEILMNEASKNYEEAIKNEEKYAEDAKVAYDNLAVAKENYANKSSKKNKEALEEAQKNYKAAKALSAESLYDIETYEEAVRISQEEGTTAVLDFLKIRKQAYQEDENSFKENVTENQKALGNASKAYQQSLYNLQIALEKYNESGSESAKAMVLSAISEVENAKEQYAAAGGELGKTWVYAFENPMKSMSGIANSVALDLKTAIEKGLIIDDDFSLGILTSLEAVGEQGAVKLYSGVSKGTESNFSILTNAGITLANTATNAVSGEWSFSKLEPIGLNFANGIASGISMGKGPVSTAVQGLTKIGTQTAINSWVIQSPSHVGRDTIGKMFGLGIAQGISLGGKDVSKETTALCGLAMTTAKKTLKINSPAKVPKDEIGKMISLGVAQGIKENSDAVVEAFQKQLDKLNYLRDFDIINEDQYYTELEKLRDKHFAVGTKEWLDYTLEIAEYQKELLEDEKERYKDTYDEIFDYASEKIDAVIEKQEEYSKKLKSYGNLFNKNTIKLDEGDIEFYSLADIRGQIDDIAKFNDLMSQAREKALASGMSQTAVDSILNEFSSLDIEEGTGMLTALLSAGDKDLAEWFSAYDEKLSYADSSSAAMFKSEMDAAIDESTELMKQKLSDAGFEIPETFFNAGKDSANKFGEAFSKEIDAELSKIKQRFDSFNCKIQISIEKSESGSGKVSNDNRVYSDNRTTNIYAASSSPHDIAEATKQQSIYEKHTSRG